ncbi:MAG TPA: hypothetical protein VL025_04670 [Thermoanaerobaculia bacterium]|nr:hypothetical protein [Thermoanaerobaculia bacterium]
MSVAALALLFPLAGQAQGGRDAYTDVRVMVKDLSTNQEIGEIPPGGSFDLPDGSKVRLIMRVYAPGRGSDSRPIYPRTTYSEGNPGRGGVRITATNEENANATLELVRLPDSAQRTRSELIRYQISDSEGRIPNNLERGSVTINVVPASATGQVGSSTGSTTARRAEELTRVLYQAILLRDPDQGARGTIDAIERGGYDALVQAAVGIANSDESRVRLYEQSGMTNERRLIALYKNLLGLDPSQVDRSVWVNDLQQLGNGQVANVVDEIVRSERFRSRYNLNAAY